MTTECLILRKETSIYTPTQRLKHLSNLLSKLHSRKKPLTFKNNRKITSRKIINSKITIISTKNCTLQWWRKLKISKTSLQTLMKKYWTFKWKRQATNMRTIITLLKLVNSTQVVNLEQNATFSILTNCANLAKNVARETATTIMT